MLQSIRSDQNARPSQTFEARAKLPYGCAFLRGNPKLVVFLLIKPSQKADSLKTRKAHTFRRGQGELVSALVVIESLSSSPMFPENGPQTAGSFVHCFSFGTSSAILTPKRRVHQMFVNSCPGVQPPVSFEKVGSSDLSPFSHAKNVGSS